MLELKTPPEAASWLRSRVKGALQSDSRKVGAADGFLAWPGAATDGRQHVHAALAQGALACLVERSGVEAFAFDQPAIAAFGGLKTRGRPDCSRVLRPAHRTVAGRCRDRHQRQDVDGLVARASDVGWRDRHAGHRTAAGSRLQRAHDSRSGPAAGAVPTLSGLTACPCARSKRRRSVSAERRLDGTTIRVAIFTNFTQDHLDYHGNMEAYWEAKTELFRWQGLRAAVINIDDAKGTELAQSLQGSDVDLWTVSCQQPARLTASDIGYDAQGLRFTVHEGAEQQAACHRAWSASTTCPTCWA